MRANKPSHLTLVVIFLSSFATLSFSTATKSDASIDASSVYPEETFLVLTVASEEPSSAFKRFLRSVSINKLPTKVLGQGAPPDAERKSIALLLKELEMHKDHYEMIVMFVDTLNGDALVNADRENIVKTFQSLDARVVFSAGDSCWPDESLVSQYPEVKEGQRFLNSALFIGYASDIYKMLNGASEIIEGEQLFFTKIFLDEKKRNELNIKLDHQSQLFQNLKWSIENDVLLTHSGKEVTLSNRVYKTAPLVVYASGPSGKQELRTIADYIPKAWNQEDGCISCWDDMISLGQKKPEEYPVVVIAIFVETATPFMDEFWKKFVDLVYPKEKIHLFIYNKAAFHSMQIERFIAKQGKEYLSTKFINHKEKVKEHKARDMAIEYCVEKKCDFYLSLDSVAHIENAHLLNMLIEQNRPVLSPLLVQPYKTLSNFWSHLTTDERLFARSNDYTEIIQGERRGLWSVPFVSNVYLVRGDVIHNPRTKPSFTSTSKSSNRDITFSDMMRESNVDMYVTNRLDWGHLVSAEKFSTNHIYNELYEMINNRWDWEKRYLHANYSRNLDSKSDIEQPCYNVFWFPLVTERFCDELIDELENSGKWALVGDISCSENDGHETVANREIHMDQIGMKKIWLRFIKQYIQPLQERVFQGFQGRNPPESTDYVIRYQPDDHPNIKPHHDASTYTANIALNRAGIDYQGGGVRFIRENCSVVDSRKGWMLMHPGRLTHYHEALPTTNGTRYVFITMVDP